MKENYGDLEALKKLGEGKTRDYTTEQLLDENLKNKDGESNLEVRKRMLEILYEILEKHNGKRIVVVSHGAAIKFLLQNFCEYICDENIFKYNGETVCMAKLESPCIIKMIFKDKIINVIEKLAFM